MYTYIYAYVNIHKNAHKYILIFTYMKDIMEMSLPFETLLCPTAGTQAKSSQRCVGLGGSCLVPISGPDWAVIFKRQLRKQGPA